MERKNARTIRPPRPNFRTANYNHPPLSPQMLPSNWKSKEIKAQPLGTVCIIAKARIYIQMQALDVEKEDANETQSRTARTKKHYLNTESLDLNYHWPYTT